MYDFFIYFYRAIFSLKKISFHLPFVWPSPLFFFASLPTLNYFSYAFCFLLHICPVLGFQVWLKVPRYTVGMMMHCINPFQRHSLTRCKWNRSDIGRLFQGLKRYLWCRCSSIEAFMIESIATPHFNAPCPTVPETAPLLCSSTVIILLFCMGLMVFLLSGRLLQQFCLDTRLLAEQNNLSLIPQN